MEMKIARGVAPIVLIMYLAIRDFFFFSSKISSSVPDQHQSSSASSIHQMLIYAKPSYLFIFFTFNILLVAVLLGISSQLSKSSETSSHIEQSISSIFIDSYEGQKRERDVEDKGYYKDDFIPGIVYVDYEDQEKAQGVVESNNNIVTNFYFNTEEEVYGLAYGYIYGYVHDEEYKDDFIPEIVHVEYKEEKVEGQSNINSGDRHEDIVVIDDQKDVDVGEKDEILICEEYYGYDDEDMVSLSEEDSYSELDDIDFNKRIEEFIDENNKKWREELQNDMLAASLS